ncbi:nitrile hydratase subunit beta [Aquisalimonas sp. 2447]|uniref:SH3-like domain-containing protein n=1 Tax=Aquisalimonas sp. 2447 TaxID=2740807 RepID=UPI0014325F9F|nr:nitrile hydratase subunit beta [Aquisalimonas sp. 2447]
MVHYHDIGGHNNGPVDVSDPPWEPWEIKTEAIRNLMGDPFRRLCSLDELRFSYESYGEDLYKGLSFYARRCEAMIQVLERKGVITRDELHGAMSHRGDS